MKNLRKKNIYINSKFKKIENKLKYIKKPTIVIIFLIILIKMESITFISSRLFGKKYPSENIKKKQILILNRTELIDNYLFSIPSKYEKDKQKERKILNNLFSLKDISKEPDNPSNIELKIKLLNKITKFINGKIFTKIKSVFITSPMHFGNNMIIVNNIIYYCELFGIKNIYFDSRYNWYIKNNIISDKFKISIISNTNINCSDINTVCFLLKNRSLFYFLYYPSFIKPQIRIHILKNEIKKNLPNVKIDQNDLIIHIRSGNIFRSLHSYYSQPPLCFYKNILNNFEFKNIIIIAIDKKNPVINHLLEEFPNIIYKKNSIIIAISYLTNAYNLVGSISSFAMTAIKFNDNLKKYWDYDIYRRSEKICHLNLEYYEFPRKFTIFQMKPSENYKNEMFVLCNEPNKFRLMIEEKCINNFIIIEPNA